MYKLLSIKKSFGLVQTCFKYPKYVDVDTTVSVIVVAELSNGECLCRNHKW